MTENEAKLVIKRLVGISPSESIVRAVNMATDALEGIQQYRAIGTVEECQEAREKQIPKKPIHDGLYACPNCYTIMLQGAFEARGKCCKECGQVLDWSETV